MASLNLTIFDNKDAVDQILCKSYCSDGLNKRPALAALLRSPAIIVHTIGRYRTSTSTCWDTNTPCTVLGCAFLMSISFEVLYVIE
jgi:hypothetical protein